VSNCAMGDWPAHTSEHDSTVVASGHCNMGTVVEVGKWVKISAGLRSSRTVKYCVFFSGPCPNVFRLCVACR
jgi:D-arabinose 1-dehydrogenase-like Zn-dependent alcohol dehydrogenase